ncbi:MAG: hypothetical protein JJE47_15920 [Acidimicrobiia bacterium]|nr:hypothetical protein [Acidimicrobiia bacterium]
MNRSANLLVVFGLVLGACGTDVSVGLGTTATSIPGAAGAPTTSAVTRPITETTSGVTGDTAVSPAERAPSGVEGPVAPDFSLVLADGSTFTLSEGSRPVYMVFWAEW